MVVNISCRNQPCAACFDRVGLSSSCLSFLLLNQLNQLLINEGLLSGFRMWQEDRYSQIERDNRLLLEKMSHIMRKGGLDNFNNNAKYSKSLNKGARKKELQQITRENQVGA